MNWLITGGAGFIGSNMAATLIQGGHEVVILDDLSRRGAERNLEWLRDVYDPPFEKVDIRDVHALQRVFRDHDAFDVVSHQAAQVAVTTSVVDPRTDFEINALGTFNLLEVVRQLQSPPAVLFASTNKVYGGLEDVEVEAERNRYRFVDLPAGVPETRALDFHSPYGCSKGAADQYVLDYARVFGVPGVVFRQSCIYGRRQFGVEDQGWVAWFLIAATFGRDITVYGNGKQARDLLFVDDLVRLYIAAAGAIESVAGEVFNVGGGPDNQLSLLELLARIPDVVGKEPSYSFADWRPGDQPLYVSDNRKAVESLGWVPEIGVDEGVTMLGEWIVCHKQEIRAALGADS